MKPRIERTVFLVTLLLLFGAFAAGQFSSPGITGAVVSGEPWDFEDTEGLSEMFEVIQLSIGEGLMDFIIAFIAAFAAASVATSALMSQGSFGNDPMTKTSLYALSAALALGGSWYYPQEIIKLMLLFLVLIIVALIFKWLRAIQKGESFGWTLTTGGVMLMMLGYLLTKVDKLSMEPYGWISLVIGSIFMLIGGIKVLSELSGDGDKDKPSLWDKTFGGGKTPSEKDADDIVKEEQKEDKAEKHAEIAEVEEYKALATGNFKLASEEVNAELRDYRNQKRELEKERTDVRALILTLTPVAPATLDKVQEKIKADAIELKIMCDAQMSYIGEIIDLLDARDKNYTVILDTMKKTGWLGRDVAKDWTTVGRRVLGTKYNQYLKNIQEIKKQQQIVVALDKVKSQKEKYAEVIKKYEEYETGVKKKSKEAAYKLNTSEKRVLQDLRATLKLIKTDFKIDNDEYKHIKKALSILSDERNLSQVRIADLQKQLYSIVHDTLPNLRLGRKAAMSINNALTAYRAIPTAARSNVRNFRVVENTLKIALREASGLVRLETNIISTARGTRVHYLINSTTPWNAAYFSHALSFVRDVNVIVTRHKALLARLTKLLGQLNSAVKKGVK
jgi:hypothetical protein